MQKSVYDVRGIATSAPHDLIDQHGVTPTEFWLWWITDEFGQRRMTTYRMSREVALQRYPDARAVPGTVEIRNLPDSDTKSPLPDQPKTAPASAANETPLKSPSIEQ